MNDQTAIDDPDLEALAEQSGYMQDLIEQVDELPGSPSKILMQDCIEEILAFHNNGLQRMLQLLTKEESPASTVMMERLLEDPFVSGLLLMHDLHPHPELLEAEAAQS